MAEIQAMDDGFENRAADLARLRYEDDCCARAALANANRHQPAVVCVREQPVHNTAAMNDEAFDDIRRSFNKIRQAFDGYRQAFDGICEVLLQTVTAMEAEELAAQELATVATIDVAMRRPRTLRRWWLQCWR